MAALRLSEDKNSGRLILQPAFGSRLGGCAFSLIWLAGVGIFLLPMFGERRVDWIAVIMLLIFAFIPASVSVLNSIFVATVTIDQSARKLTSIRLLFFIPISATTFAFNDLAKIEMQSVRGTDEGPDTWLVDAVSRKGERLRLNWGGTQREMNDLAQKISALTGAPVVQSEYSLPTAVRDLLKKVAPPAPEQAKPPGRAPAPSPSTPTTTVFGRLMRDILDQAATKEAQPQRRAMPPQPDPYAPPPVAMPWATSPDESAQPRETSAPPAPPIVDDRAPAQAVWDLPTRALEQRVASDSLDADARYALARRYHSRGDLERAIDLYRQVVRIDATNPNAQNDLGVVLQTRGKRAEAESAYRRAAALDPFSATAHLNLALLLREGKRATEARQEFFLARQNARGVEERNRAEAAASGAKMDPRLSRT